MVAVSQSARWNAHPPRQCGEPFQSPNVSSPLTAAVHPLIQWRTVENVEMPSVCSASSMYVPVTKLWCADDTQLIGTFNPLAGNSRPSGFCFAYYNTGKCCDKNCVFPHYNQNEAAALAPSVTVPDKAGRHAASVAPKKASKKRKATGAKRRSARQSGSRKKRTQDGMKTPQ